MKRRYREKRQVLIRGKVTEVSLADFSLEPKGLRALYFEQDQPRSTLYLRRWKDMADVVACFERKM